MPFEIEMMPTGVNLETFGEFFKAGAIAAGVGTDVVDVKAIRANRTEKIAERAKKYLAAIQNF